VRIRSEIRKGPTLIPKSFLAKVRRNKRKEKRCSHTKVADEGLEGKKKEEKQFFRARGRIGTANFLSKDVWIAAHRKKKKGKAEERGRRPLSLPSTISRIGRVSSEI